MTHSVLGITDVRFDQNVCLLFVVLLLSLHLFFLFYANVFNPLKLKPENCYMSHDVCSYFAYSIYSRSTNSALITI